MNNDNPYQTPQANLEQATPTDHPGGNLTDAVAGRYAFVIGDVVGEAWLRTKGMKRITIGAGLLVYILIMAVVTAMVIVFGSAPGAAESSKLAQFVIQTVVAAVAYPFLVGFMMLGIRRSVDLPISFSVPFSYLAYALPVVVAAVLMTVLSMIGFMLFFIPGVYLSVAWVFALPLVVDHQLGPWAALETSRRAVTRHWFKIFGALLLLGLLAMVSAFTIIGLIWTIPMWYAGYGVLYREIFGVGST